MIVRRQVLDRKFRRHFFYISPARTLASHRVDPIDVRRFCSPRQRKTTGNIHLVTETPPRTMPDHIAGNDDVIAATRCN